MKDYIFARADVDWADEFNCECFMVQKKSEWEKDCKDLEAAFANRDSDDAIEMSFGTNEYLEVSSYEEWIGNIDVIELTKDEADLLRNLFNPYHQKGSDRPFTWGTGSRYFCVGDYI